MINSTNPQSQLNQMDIPTLLALRQQLVSQMAAGRGRAMSAPPPAALPAPRPPVPNNQRAAASLPPQTRLEALTAPASLGRMLAMGR